MVTGQFNPNHYFSQINEIKKWALNLGGVYLLWFVYFDSIRFSGESANQALVARVVFQALPIVLLLILFYARKTIKLSDNTFNWVAFFVIISVGYGHSLLIQIAHDNSLFFPRIGLTIILIYSGLLLTLPIALATISSLTIIAISSYAYVQTNMGFDEVFSVATFYLVFASCCVFTNYVVTNILWSNFKLVKLINRQANSDHLTKLSNRRHFFSEAERILNHSRKNNETLHLLIIDVDNFKSVNDHNGHQSGDEVLIKLASLIFPHGQSHNSTVARLGGDEFVLLLGNKTMEEIEHIGNEIIRGADQITQELNLHVNKSKMGVSIGISEVIDTENTSIIAMLRQADLALYQAKKHGKHKFIIWVPEHEIKQTNMA